MSRPSNLMIILLCVVSLIAGGVVAWVSANTTVLLAPLYTFAIWALVRELDPDHDWTALAAAFGTGTWVVAGLDPSGLVFAAGLTVATRLVLNSTGRRPLSTDLIGIVVVAAAVSFTTAGWVAGFAIAVAIYVDDRMTEVQIAMSVIAAAVAALAASGVATLASAFPEAVPDVIPELAIPIGILAVIAVVREPGEPASKVDSRRGTLLTAARLHATRGLAAVAVFAASILTGDSADAIGPVAIALALALVSNELEELRRNTR